jgi:very-short-patch-repair endonuclease
MDVRLRALAADQGDLVAAWQLLAAGFTRAMVDHRVRNHRWRVVHPGVYALTNAPLTRRQLWMSATLTSPDTFLSHASAGACWGIRRYEGSLEMVTRPGSGGPERLGGVLVLRSKTLDGDTTTHDGIQITTAARTVIDLAPHIGAQATGRMFREALRLAVTTMEELRSTLARHRGRRGTRVVADLAARYSSLPYQRTRSDAEGRALELLQDSGVQPPRVNTRIAGEEADLAWPERRLIIEIDGPQYHRFPDEDARKQRAWEAAGYTVHRIGSGVVYDDPGQLTALVCRGSSDRQDVSSPNPHQFCRAGQRPGD